MNNAASFLGLARKAGALVLGEEACSEFLRSGKGKLLLLASDTSENTMHRAEKSLNGHRALSATYPGTREELGALFGRGTCSMVCFTDLSFASRYAALMAEQDEGWSDAADILKQRYEKMVRRKAAPKKQRSTDKGGHKIGS